MSGNDLSASELFAMSYLQSDLPCLDPDHPLIQIHARCPRYLGPTTGRSEP